MLVDVKTWNMLTPQAAKAWHACVREACHPFAVNFTPCFGVVFHVFLRFTDTPGIRVAIHSAVKTIETF
jgi:hypothetical protein